MESVKLSYLPDITGSGMKPSYDYSCVYPDSSFRGSEADLFSPAAVAAAAAAGPNGGANLAAAPAMNPFGLGVPGPQGGHILAGTLPGGHPLGGLGPHFAPLGAAPQQMFSPHVSFAANDAKKHKVKLDGGSAAQMPQQQQMLLPQSGSPSLSSPPISRVVLLANMPEATTNTDVCTLGAPYGKITAASIVDHKRQGYLEFEDERCAMNMVQRCKMSPPILRGNQLLVQYSNPKEMKSMISGAAPPQMGGGPTGYMDMSPMTVGLQHQLLSNAAAAANASQQQPCNEIVQQPHPSMVFQAGGPDGPQGDGRTVLRVIVEMGENQNIYNQVNLDVLHHLFSRTGNVLKIITFAKPGYPQQFQALIQYDQAKSAQTAKELFDGQNLYYGCCPLKVEYSKLNNLNVKFNNEKSKDFTRELPSGEAPPASIGMNDPTAMLAAIAAAGMLPGAGAYNPLTAHLGGMAPMNPFANPFAMSPALYLEPWQHIMATNNMAAAAAAGGLPIPTNTLLQQLQRTSAATVPGIANGIPQPTTNCVLLVGNLNTDKVTCDGLFTLFGVYGDVQRVKILFNKQDSALIQLATESQANIAIENLNEMCVYGKEMRVALSKHQLVQMPKEGQPDAGLTRDYTNSPLHRFRKQGSKNYQNIYSPSSTLHLSNIAPGATEEQILDAFSKKSIEVVHFRFFPELDENDHKMALVQCRNKEDAIVALVELHNFQLGENHHLRVSFSKTQMGMAAAAAAVAAGSESIPDSPNGTAITPANDLLIAV